MTTSNGCVTYCKLPFALEISRIPFDRDAWKACIQRRPEVCPKGCTGAHCQQVCRDYANVQRKCAGLLAERRGRK